MHGPSEGALSPQDAALVARWQAAGCPPVPLAADDHEQVYATTTNLATILRIHTPAWQRYRAAAVRWVDEHCAAR
jgi:hypothetical protein